MIFRLRIPINDDMEKGSLPSGAEYQVETEVLNEILNSLQDENTNAQATEAKLREAAFEPTAAAALSETVKNGTSHFLLWLTQNNQPGESQGNTRGTMVVYASDTETTVALVPQDNGLTQVIIGSPERLKQLFHTQLEVRVRAAKD
jgi:hypothetical protein